MSEFNITPAQKAAITRAVNSLNKVRAELEEDNPDAPNVSWYLEDCGNLNLMSDDSHTGGYLNANRAAVEGVWDLANSSGGGW